MSDSDRTSIIKAVRTPLAFYTLAVLIGEAVLVLVVQKANGLDFTIIVVGMVLLPFVLIGAVAFGARGKGEEVVRDHDTTNRKYDVFLASVLAGFDDDDRLVAERETALAVVDALQNLGLSVYYAGRSVMSKSDFDGTEIGAREDIEALHDSRHFIMLFPGKILSSVLFEAGYAYQRCETSTYFVHDKEDLPYLMRRLPEVHQTFLRTLLYGDVSDIVKLIEKRGDKLFKFSEN